MRRLIAFLFLLITNNSSAAVDAAQEGLIHPQARVIIIQDGIMRPQRNHLVDLRDFPRFYEHIAGRGSTRGTPEERLELRRHPIISVDQCLDFMGYTPQVKRLARRFLGLHKFEIKREFRRTVLRYQNTFNFISLLMSERRPAAQVLRMAINSATQTLGDITVENHPGYIRLPRPAPLPAGATKAAVARCADGISRIEALRLDHLRRSRLCLADTRYGGRPMGPLLDREMVRGWRIVQASSRASTQVSSRLVGSSARLFGPRKNYASLRAIVLDIHGNPVEALDPGVVASSGTMPLGVEGTRVVHHEATGMAALVSQEFPLPVIYPGSSENWRETLAADAEIRARAAALAAGEVIEEEADAAAAAAGGMVGGAAGVAVDRRGPAQKAHDRRALASLRGFCECCHGHAPRSTRAYIAKKGSHFPYTTEEDYHRLYGHSEQAWRSVVENWLPHELAMFMRRNPSINIGRVILILSSLRDACSQCSMSLSELMSRIMLVRKAGIGYQPMTSPLMVVNGYKAYLVQYLRRLANGKRRFDMTTSRSSRVGSTYAGVNLEKAYGVFTIDVLKNDDEEDPLPLS